MNKKKLVILASTLILAAATVAGGTLAYFTHSTEVVNILTTGNVKISLKEDAYVADNAKDIVPGRVIPKDPTITNDGTNDCYVRVELVASLLDKDGKPSTQAVTAAQLVELMPGWAKGVGEADNKYYYYKSKLAKGESARVFEKMTIPTSWGNSYQGLTLNLKVIAHAIQADNFAPAVTNGNITGWGTVVVEK